MMVLTLARKPFTGTVGQNVVPHGTGVLNINACRIGFASEAGEKETVSGRWPANMVLEHDPNCQRNGVATEEVPLFDSSHTDRFIVRDADVKIARTGKMRGLSTEAWLCVAGCPVKVLDDQSGILKTGGGVRNSPKPTGVFGTFSGKENSRTFEANEGGASRYFKQIQCIDPE